MDPKPRPNRQRSLDALRRMTPQQRLAKAFELSEMTRKLELAGLRQRHPDVGEVEIRRLLKEQRKRWLKESGIVIPYN